MPVLVATAGNVLGACTTYWLGRAAVTVVSPRARKTQRAAALLRRYGAPAMLLSWVPLLGDVLVILAGAAGMPLSKFTVWVVIGKFARYAVVALAIRRL